MTHHPAISCQHPPVGLLAGAGRFPVAFAVKARQIGLPVVGVGLRSIAPPELPGLCDDFHWVGLARLGGIIRHFKRAGVREVVMAGKVEKTAAFSPWRILRLLPDWRTLRFWYNRRRRDNRDDSILLGVIAEFERDGLRFSSALDYCPEMLVRAGQIGRAHV